jgi:hypothetical protein
MTQSLRKNYLTFFVFNHLKTYPLILNSFFFVLRGLNSKENESGKNIPDMDSEG